MKQTSGWVDKPGVYLNLFTFTARTPTPSLGFVFLAYSISLVQTVKDEQVICCVRGSPNSATYIPTYILLETLFSGFLLYGDRYFIYRRIYVLLIIFLIALSLSSFHIFIGILPFSPGTPIAASCKLLRTSPTIQPSLSPYLISAGFQCADGSDFQPSE